MNMDKKHDFVDDELINYLEGTQPGKPRRELERRFYLSGELSDFYRMMKDMYDNQSNPADDLLGRNITDSEDLKRVFREANELQKNKPADISMDAYLKSLLSERLSLSEEKAERIYGRLLAGVNIYYSSYNQVIVENDDYLSMIKSFMKEMDTEEMIDYLSSIYVLLLMYNKKVKTEDPNALKKEVEKLSTQLQDEEEAIEKLQDQIQIELKDAEFPGGIIEEETLRKLKNDFSIKYVLESWLLDKDFAVYSAVCAYIAQIKGEMQMLDPSVEINEDIIPVAIGAGMAAGVKQSELTNQVLTGEIEESTFMKYIKIAACVTAFALVVYLALHFGWPLISTVIQSMAPAAAVGFWWKAYAVATLMMFFASLTLNVLLQGAFVAAIVWLIIEAFRDWIPADRENYVKIDRLSGKNAESAEEGLGDESNENELNQLNRQNKLKH